MSEVFDPERMEVIRPLETGDTFVAYRSGEHRVVQLAYERQEEIDHRVDRRALIGKLFCAARRSIVGATLLQENFPEERLDLVYALVDEGPESAPVLADLLEENDVDRRFAEILTVRITVRHLENALISYVVDDFDERGEKRRP